MDDRALRAAARRHVDRFNGAVRSGDWAGFATEFAAEAVMRFTNLPVGPFIGRAAIEQGYYAQPPDDTMTIRRMEGIDSDTVLVGFTWDADGPGTMLIRWGEGLVRELVITFG